MVSVNSNFSYDSDFSKVTADIQKLVREATNANSVFAQLNKTAAAVKTEAARSFSGLAGAAGFKAQIVDLTGATEDFGKQLQKNKLTMREYFREAAQAYKKDSKARALAEREVRRANSTVVGMGDIGGRRKGVLLTPQALDMKNSEVRMALMNKQYEIFNDLVNKGATELVNWGKNTQWAGRQLTVGLTVPMGIFASQALKAFAEVDKEITRFRKVYGSDLMSATEDSTNAMIAQIQGLGSEFAKQYGIASSQTMALAADLAAAGLEGEKLANAVNQTTRMMVLGEVDRQQAMQATLSIQTAFNQSSKELAKSVDFLNAVENQTSASLQDLTEAIPKTGPVIQSLGGDIKDLAVLMTAMREGGIAAGEGANAIKSGMASLISPTKQAIDVARQFGIDLEGVVNRNKGQLMPMLLDFQDQLKGLDDFGKAKIIEQIFGKYQFARISALFDNLNQQGSQTVGIIKLMDQTGDELAKKAYSELKAQENAPSTRLAAMQQQLQENLVRVGADLAESLLPVMQTALDILQKIVDGFNNLPAPIKSFAKILAGVTAVSGPILMLAGVFGNLVGNAVKFGMSIVNMFKRLSGNPVQKLQILDDEQLAAKISAEQLTGAYERQKTSIQQLNAALDIYIANLREAAAVAPPGAINPGPRRGPAPIRRQSGGIIFAQNGVDSGGRINGYGGGDTVPAMLEPGEFVINKKSSQKYKGLLTDINKGKDIRGYNGGGEVTSDPSGGVDYLDSKNRVRPNRAYIEPDKAAISLEETPAFQRAIASELGTQYMQITEDRIRAYMEENFRAVLDPADFDSILREALNYGISDRSHIAGFRNVVEFEDWEGQTRQTTRKAMALGTMSEPSGYNRSSEDLRNYLTQSVNGEIRPNLSNWERINQHLSNPFTPDEISDLSRLLSKTGVAVSIQEKQMIDMLYSRIKEGIISGPNPKELIRAFSNSSDVNAGKMIASMIYNDEMMSLIRDSDGSIKRDTYRQVLKNQLISAAQREKVYAQSAADIDRFIDDNLDRFMDEGITEETQTRMARFMEEKTGLKTLSESEQRARTDLVSEKELLRGSKTPTQGRVFSQSQLGGKGAYIPVNLQNTGRILTSFNDDQGRPVPIDLDELRKIRKNPRLVPRVVMTPRGPRVVGVKGARTGGMMMPNGTFVRDGVLHAAGGFTGFPGSFTAKGLPGTATAKGLPGTATAKGLPGTATYGTAAAMGARRKASVFDIDKTIIQTVTGVGKDWAKATLERGTPMPNQLAAIKAAQERGDEIVFLTARPDAMKPETIATLEKLGIKDFKLRMMSKAQGDPRKASEYKVKAIRELQRDYDINSVWDDEFPNIMALRKEGIDVKLPVITNGHNPFVQKFRVGGMVSAVKAVEKAMKVPKPKIRRFGPGWSSLSRQEREEVTQQWKLYDKYLYERKNAKSIDETGMSLDERNKQARLKEKLDIEARIKAAQEATGRDDLLARYLGERKNIRGFSRTQDELLDFDNTNTVFNLLLKEAKGTNAADRRNLERLRAEANKYKSWEEMPPGLQALIADQFAIHRGKPKQLKPFSEFESSRSYDFSDGPLEGPGLYTSPTLVGSDSLWDEFSGPTLNRIRYDDDAFNRVLNSRGYITGMRSLADEYAGWLRASGRSKDSTAEKLFKTNKKFKGKEDFGIDEFFQGMPSNHPFFKYLKDRGYIGVQTGLKPAQDTSVSWMAGEPGVSVESFSPSKSGIVGYQNGGVIFGHGMNSGGKLNGYGGGDTVPAMLEPGEFVINKKSSNKYGPLLAAINRDQLPGFENGLVDQYGNPLPSSSSGQTQDGGNDRLGKNRSKLQMAGGMGGVAMNAAFLPMTFMTASAMEDGMMKTVTQATGALQALVLATQLATAAQVAFAKGGVASNALSAVSAKGGAMKGAFTAAKQGGAGVMRSAGAAAMVGGKGLVSGIGTALAGISLPLMGVLAVVAAIGIGIWKWRDNVDKVKEGMKDTYGEATEMAKVYNIEINKTSKALQENKKVAEQLGYASQAIGKGIVDKDFAAAVTKDYGQAIEAIKGLETQQEKVNRITAVYSSLVSQGFSLEQAKEITAELARQASATEAFNTAMAGSAGKIQNTEDAMRASSAAAVESIDYIVEREGQVEAIKGAYNNLLRLSAENPIEFNVQTDKLFENAGAKNSEALQDSVNQMVAEMGFEEGSFTEKMFADIDYADQAGRETASLYMKALALNIDLKSVVAAAGNDIDDIKAELKVRINTQTAVAETKKLLNQQMDQLIKSAEAQIDTINKAADKKITAYEKEKDALQEGHEARMKQLEQEAKALQDRADLIRDNTDFYISQLEKEYNAESYYQNQRKTALGGLDALSKGDIFGYLESQMQSASDAEQYGREQSIQQIEDTRDAALKSIDAQLKMNQEAASAASEALQDGLDNIDEKIEDVNTKRSKAVKGLTELIDMAKEIKAKGPGEVAAKDLQKLEDKGVEVGKKVPQNVQAAVDAMTSNIVENFGTAVGAAVNKIATESGLSAEASTDLLNNVLGMFSSTIPSGRGGKGPKNNDAGDAARGANNLPENPPAVVSKKQYAIGSTFPTKSGIVWSLVKNGKTVEWQAAGKKAIPVQYKNKGGLIYRFNRGSLVPGVGNTDTVPAMLTPGEFVVNKQATAQNLPLLQALNSGGRVGYNTGGFVGGMPAIAMNKGGRVPEFKMPMKSGIPDTSREIENNNVSVSVTMNNNVTFNGANMGYGEIRNKLFGELANERKKLSTTLKDGGYF